ncbi:MAG: hypothetical protein AAFQ87_08885 [Bacteroidota bacterium]
MKVVSFLSIMAAMLTMVACSSFGERIPEPDPLPDPDQGCEFYNQNPDWLEEDFKFQYTIRFTSGYQGGISGFEGNMFSKWKADTSISVRYAYCGPLWCDDFRDTLIAPLPAQLFIPAALNQGIPDSVLAPYSETVYSVCDSTAVIGVLYYTDTTGPGMANFYMGKPDSLVLEALGVEYRAGALAEVFTILGTIEDKF